ncbi:MAG: integrase, partial [Thermanaeromonas sp.]
PYTIRNILRRSGVKCRKVKTYNGQKRYFVNLSAFKPLQFWQIDTKYIADQHALPLEAYAAILRNKLPKYQFTAIDIKTRLRFIAYATELNFKNGLTFLLLLAYWLRAFGVIDHLFFQTDNGEEFGGSATSRKRTLMQNFIFNHLDVSLLNIPAGQKQFNTFVERSHRTDDEEFYAINLAKVTSRTSFFKMAQDWILYFNYQRSHFGRDMKGKTPVQALHASRMAINPAVGAMPVLLLDQVSLYLDYFWNISTIPWDNSPKNLKLVNETMAHYPRNSALSILWPGQGGQGPYLSPGVLKYQRAPAP